MTDVRVVVFGAGAMGSLVGALLSRTAEVTLVARAGHARAVSRAGLRVEGLTRGTYRPHATTSARAVGDCDLIVLTTKSYDTAEAARAMRRAGASAPVLSLQNGLTNIPQLLAALPESPVLGGTTTHGVTFLRPGAVLHAGRGETVVGAARGSPGLARRTAALFTDAGIECRVTTRLPSLLWKKAVVNAAINPLTACLRVENGRVLERTESRLTARLAAEEAGAVARAEGSPVRRPWDDVRRVLAATAHNRSSMLQDIEAGRRTEVESITGQIVRAARRHGLEVPVNAGLLRAVRAL